MSKSMSALNARRYLCDICGKTYTQSSHLWQHLRVHQGAKPFMCKESGCERKFTIRSDLNDHIRSCHTGDRPFQCIVCEKRFLTRSNFYQHHHIHQNDRRFWCITCSKRFYRADTLKIHQRIHTGEKPFDCPHCKMSFRQRTHCNKHVHARHGHLNEDEMERLEAKEAAVGSSAALQTETSTAETLQQENINPDAKNDDMQDEKQKDKKDDLVVDSEDDGEDNLIVDVKNDLQDDEQPRKPMYLSMPALD